MQISVREIISDVRISVRGNSIDDWMPSKYIHSKLKGYAALFIKREADEKRLFKYTELWTPIDCLKLEETDLINCCECDIDIPSCKTVMKSKLKLPDIYSTRFGYLIQVSSVDYGKSYIQTTPRAYQTIVNREYIDKSLRYFWIENGHVVVPGVMVEVIKVSAMFVNKAEALKLQKKCNNEDDSCILFLDHEFVAPVHLLNDIKNATIIDILKSNKAIQPDEYPNENANEKTNPKK